MATTYRKNPALNRIGCAIRNHPRYKIEMEVYRMKTQLNQQLGSTGSHFCRGLTLVELMITLAVIGIAAVITLPQLTQMTQQNRMTEYINVLSRDINYARSEAISRGTRITMRSNNGVDWTQGWQVLDQNNNPLRQYGTAGGGQQMIQSGLAFTETTGTLAGAVGGDIIFKANGGVTNNAEIALCDNTDANTKNLGKLLAISSTGRVQIKNKTKEDGTAVCP